MEKWKGGREVLSAAAVTSVLFGSLSWYTWAAGERVTASGSVLLSSLCALTCFAILVARRKVCGAEFGSRFRWPTFAVFCGLWVLYIALSWKS